jgi:hypothetical protein
LKRRIVAAAAVAIRFFDLRAFDLGVIEFTGILHLGTRPKIVLD